MVHRIERIVLFLLYVPFEVQLHTATLVLRVRLELGFSSHRGLQRVAALGLLDRSKSETQGQLSWCGGGVIRPRLGLLHLDSRDTSIIAYSA